MTGYVAVCQQCGELTDGAADLEEAGDVAEAHDEFGCDVEVKRLTADGGKRRTVEVCPECDSTRIHRNPGGYSTPGSRARYGCDNCSAAFAEPDEREAKAPAQAPSNPRARRLYQADPDDLRADGSGFATGGGEGPDQVVVHCPSCETDFESLDAEEEHDCNNDDDDPDAGAPALIADGGHPLPESFEAFARREECPACGDVVHEDRIADNVCVGCQHRTDDPGLSAEVGRPVQPRDDRIFERREAMSARRHGDGGEA